ncbi:dynamin family protein [Opitutus sp. ER46]|uniref:dynamin family protein n=1 Tax=Opitutus sp. ER46 TaxID=2161864 RepID=UPI000D2FD9F3|nr:dynamin family protein [Opitutus sp. ER46]PTX91197.1 hypothetical protein DB354_21435 [Opitutus sp. ER46]
MNPVLPATPTPGSPAQPTVITDRQSVITLLERMALVETKLFERPSDAMLTGTIDRVRRGIFRLVVMGEVKKGKSSFINALCGLPGLVPVHSDVATSTLFKISYGPKVRYTVCWEIEGIPSREISPAELPAYGTEAGNPGNAKQVGHIAVEAPARVLQDGLVIVDTPGIGGLYAKHREITYRHAPDADAVFFVTDSVESPLGSEELSFLAELRKITGNLVFIQTKAEVGRQAAQQRMANNLAILEHAGFPRAGLRYFCLSSRLKTDADQAAGTDPEGAREDLADSGFPALLQEFQARLIRQKEINLCTTALSRARERLTLLETEAADKRRVTEADTKEKRDAIQRELEAAQAAIRTWETERQPGLLREFADSLNGLKIDLNTSLAQKFKPGGDIAEAIEHQLAKATDAQAMYAMVNPLAEEARAEASQVLVLATRRLHEGVTRLVGALADKAGAQIALKLDPHDEHAAEASDTGQTALAALAQKAEDRQVFEKAKMGFFGGMAAMTMASMAGGLIGSVVPVVGTILGSSLGVAIAGLWGSALTLEHRRKQQAESAKREIMGAINQLLGSAQLAASAELSKAAVAAESAATATLRSAVADIKERLDRRVKELAARHRQTEAQLGEERGRNKAIETTLARLRQELQLRTAALNAPQS